MLFGLINANLLLNKQSWVRQNFGHLRLLLQKFGKGNAKVIPYLCLNRTTQISKILLKKNLFEKFKLMLMSAT